MFPIRPQNQKENLKKANLANPKPHKLMLSIAVLMWTRLSLKSIGF